MSLKKFTEWCEFKEMDANQMTMGGATPMASAQAPAQPAGNQPLGNASSTQSNASEQELSKLASNVESKYQNFIGALPKSMPKAMWVNLLHNFASVAKGQGKLNDDELKKIVLGQHSVTKKMTKNHSEPQVGGVAANQPQVGNQPQMGQ